MTIIKKYKSCTFYQSPSNCKLMYAEHFGALAALEPAVMKLEIKKLKRGVLFVTVVGTHLKDKILQNFKVISCTPVAAGYSGADQYHIAIYPDNGNSYGLNAYKKALKRKATSGIDMEKVNSYKSITWLKKYLNSVV